MPRIHSVPTPKGKVIWESFKQLKQTRDAIIHLKARDQHGADNETLFYRLLSISAREYPIAAVKMIRYFCRTDSEPRWLKLFGG
jgi:hypothetical protein